MMTISQNNQGKHVAVLMGGFSREREVSLSTGQSCATALRQAGYRVTCIDVTDTHSFMAQVNRQKPAVIFNALHGTFGEDGQLPALLNHAHMPYTHSGVRASQMALNKGTCQALFQRHNLPIAPSYTATQQEIRTCRIVLPIPFVVKALCEGSSLGITFVHTEQDLKLLSQWDYGDALVEQYVAGREFTCTVLDTPQGLKPLAITELVAPGSFYDYSAKYSEDPSLLARHICPAVIEDDLQSCILQLSQQCHALLGCRGISRTDFLWDDSRNALVILETNTHPGMTPTSHAPEQAQVAGYGFEELVTLLVETARCD